MKRERTALLKKSETRGSEWKICESEDLPLKKLQCELKKMVKNVISWKFLIFNPVLVPS